MPLLFFITLDTLSEKPLTCGITIQPLNLSYQFWGYFPFLIFIFMLLSILLFLSTTAETHIISADVTCITSSSLSFSACSTEKHLSSNGLITLILHWYTNNFTSRSFLTISLPRKGVFPYVSALYVNLMLPVASACFRCWVKIVYLSFLNDF